MDRRPGWVSPRGPELFSLGWRATSRSKKKTTAANLLATSRYGKNDLPKRVLLETWLGGLWFES